MTMHQKNDAGDGLNLEWQGGNDGDAKPDPSRLGVTGQLPWRQGASDPNDPRRQTSSIEGVDWEELDEESSTMMWPRPKFVPVRFPRG